MRSFSSVRRLKLWKYQPAFCTSAIIQRPLSAAGLSSEHIDIRPLHTTRSLPSTPLPQPQPDHELDSTQPQAQPHEELKPIQEPEPDPQLPPLIYPTRATPSLHHDLPSFLSHAARTSLSPKSTVYQGTHYEYTVLSSLFHLGFSLHRVGGASDNGIDLLGTWSLPPLPAPLRVIVQCKALAKRGLRPASVRELEGAFIGAPAGWRKGEREGNVVGLLVAPGPSTKGVRDAIGRSRWPMGFVCCDREDGRVRQFVWNQAAVREGLEGVGVGWKYEEGGGEGSLVLTWKGRPMELGGGDGEREGSADGTG